MRRTLLSITLGATIAASAALLPTAASADGDTSVTLVVKGPDGKPAKNISVDFSTEEEKVFLSETTDENGAITAATDPSLYGGEWTMTLHDDDARRLTANTAYALTPQVVELADDEVNDLGTLSMAAGARVVVTVKAPSGKPYKNLPVVASDADRGGAIFRLRGTSASGVATIPGIYPTTVTLAAGEDSESLPFPGVVIAKNVVVSQAGSSVPVTVKNYRVRCQSGFSVSSPKKGQAKLTIKATAANSGISKPGGKVVIKNGSKTVKTIAWKNLSSKSITLTGQSKGKKVTYKVVYTGGDCLGWSASKSVKITK